MQQLVKPSEYAKMHGLSRQSVYAKIKRGTLPSRKIDGRYYVIIAEELEPEEQSAPRYEEPIEHVSKIEEYREIIRAKDETIEALKNSIADLKEANAQITHTLQEEIALLKQAFHEMKEIYRRDHLLTHADTDISTDAPHDANETIEVEMDDPADAKSTDAPREEKTKKRKKRAKSKTSRHENTEEECWIPLGDLIQRKKYNYNQAKQIVKRFKKAYKKDDPRIRKQNGIYYIYCYDFYEDILE